jgi:acyl carrier protein
MNDIAERVSNVVVAKLHIPAERVTQSASFIDDLAATSLDVVETIMSLEDEFGIEISDRDAEHLQTVGDVVALIGTKVHFRGVSDATTGAGSAAVDH